MRQPRRDGGNVSKWRTPPLPTQVEENKGRERGGRVSRERGREKRERESGSLTEIIVRQEHCGGNTAIIYRGNLRPGGEISLGENIYSLYTYLTVLSISTTTH